MPVVQPQIRRGGSRRGGVIGYPLDELYEEIAFVAFHFHWSEREVMQMEHEERRRWVAEISKLNRRVSEGR
jgi:hypothetical protein